MTQQEIFYWAIRNNCTKILKHLLKEKFRVDPAADDGHAIRLASGKGHVEVVRQLLAAKNDKGEFRVDPEAYNNGAIMLAIQRGNVEVVRELLAAKDRKGKFRVNSVAENNYAIKWAEINGNKEIVKLLSEEIKKRNSL